MAKGVPPDHRAQEVFETALDLEEEDRAAYLLKACAGDRELRNEVEALIRSLGHVQTEELFPTLDLRSLLVSDELRPGQRIGRHIVLEKVGAGGAGTVYVAYDTVLERRIALKVLSVVQGDPTNATRVIAEASAMARVRHPNVMTVHDVGIVDGFPFVAMEYVSGLTLGEWQQQRHSIREIMKVMAAVAQGLDAAHRAQIVHRDVKPDNILIDGERVLVTDFGLCVRDGCGVATVAGTPGYMAPEQYRAGLATEATDVFGFCATYYEMLYERRPFGSGSLEEIQMRVMAGQVKQPPRRMAVPAYVRRLVLAGLAADPAARPASMAVIATTLLADPARRVRRALATLLAAALVLASFWVGRRHDQQARPLIVSGPAWVQPAQPVPAKFFGVTMQSTTGTMPSFRVGAVRFWDSRTRWANLEPARGQFDWTTLDRLVAGATKAGLPITFTLGGTPAWAAPGTPRGPYDDGSRTGPPDNLFDWENFLTALAGRYGDRIEAYETWVLGDDRRFYTGSVERLVEMTRVASRIIKSLAPRTTLVCPGMGRLWHTDGRLFLQRFSQLGGFQHCDVANVKLYAQNASDPPETMLELVATTDRLLHEANVHPLLWNTGTAYEIPLAGELDETTAINYAVRFFLVGIYARLSRMYFYNWGGTKIPIVLQAEGGAPTAAALAVGQLERWLSKARLSSCGQGSRLALPDNVWECRFVLPKSSGSSKAAIRWTHQGTASTERGQGVVLVHRLDGSSTTLPPSEPILVTEQPILIEWK